MGDVDSHYFSDVELITGMSCMVLSKPSWLQNESWSDFITAHRRGDGTFACAETNCSCDADTVDHIRPRSHDDWKDQPAGAADAVSNLQPMCRSHNSSKGTRPDSYWSGNFLFDRQLDLTKLRASQNDYLYQAIREYDDEFSRPWSQINGKLFCFFQIVGAGKTLGMFALPFALNHAVLSNSRGGHKGVRADRVLILVKDQQLRKQIAAELYDEPFRFGFVGTRPRVLEAKGSDDLERGSVGPYDFVVACQQTIWPRENSAIACRWDLLSKFPVIAFDEMHWSPTRIHELVHNARNSLCFGFTASPIAANGQLMDDIVKVSTFGFREALLHDNSMKGLGAACDDQSVETAEDGLPTFSDIISEVQPEAVTDLDGNVEVVDLTNPVIGGELPYMLNVANGAVEEVYRLDRRRKDAVPSGHRIKRHSKDVEQVVTALDYPSHAMIRVPNIKYAEYVCDYLNSRFETDRGRYPLEKGWAAVTAHGANADYSAKELDKDSNPWFRALREKGELDQDCARFLIVSDMAKEGTNNKFCNVIAFAKPLGSMIEAVQVIGRGIRSVHVVQGSELQVPDHYLDNIRIVTHRCFEGGDSFARRQHRIIEALRFIENMERVEDVPSLPQWFSGEIDVNDPDDPNESRNALSNEQFVRMIVRLSREISKGKRIEVRKYQDDFGGRSRTRRQEVLETVEGLKARDPEIQRRVRHRIKINHRIEPDGEDLLIDELVDLRKEGTAAVGFVLDYDFGPELEAMFESSGKSNDEIVAVCEKMVPKLRSNDYSGQQVATRVDIVDVTRSIAESLIDSARLGDLRSEVHALVNQGVKHYLGRPRCSLGRQSEANKPAVVLRLSEQGVKNNITGWVLTKLINKHALNDLAEVIAVTPDENQSDEFDNDNN